MTGILSTAADQMFKSAASTGVEAESIALADF